jgi:hypothetical protein
MRIRRRSEMRLREIVAAMMILVSMGLILACSEEKIASLEGHEDIVAVLQKLPRCVEKPDPVCVNEIYVHDATLIHNSALTGHMDKTMTGLKEIEDWKVAQGTNYRWKDLSISSIEKGTDTANVQYSFMVETSRGAQMDAKFKCSAKLVKQGQKWKIKEEIIKYR